MLMPIGGPATGIRGGIAEAPEIHANVTDLGDESSSATPPHRPAAVLPAPASGVRVQQPGSPVADAGGPVRLPEVDLVPQMTELVVASGTVALNVAAQRRALKAYRAVADPDEGLRRVPDAGEADQIGG